MDIPIDPNKMEIEEEVKEDEILKDNKRLINKPEQDDKNKMEIEYEEMQIEKINKAGEQKSTIKKTDIEVAKQQN